MANNIQKLAESVTNLDPDETDRLADQILEQIKLLQNKWLKENI